MTPPKRNALATAAAVLLGVATAWLVTPPSVRAADHIDFPDAMLGADVEGAADISDLHVWTVRPGRLALVMNAHPLATDASRFSDAVDYQFRLRPVTMKSGQGSVQIPELSDQPEVVISCGVEGDVVTCRAPHTTVSAQLGEVSGSDKSEMRVFAGLRGEAFFLDIAGVGATIKSMFGPEPKLAMPLPEPKNFSDNLNTLSIVIELDVAPLFAGKTLPLLAVVAETARRSP